MPAAYLIRSSRRFSWQCRFSCSPAARWAERLGVPGCEGFVPDQLPSSSSCWVRH